MIERTPHRGQRPAWPAWVDDRAPHTSLDFEGGAGMRMRLMVDLLIVDHKPPHGVAPSREPRELDGSRAIELEVLVARGGCDVAHADRHARLGGLIRGGERDVADAAAR